MITNKDLPKLATTTNAELQKLADAAVAAASREGVRVGFASKRLLITGDNKALVWDAWQAAADIFRASPRKAYVLRVRGSRLWRVPSGAYCRGIRVELTAAEKRMVDYGKSVVAPPIRLACD